MTEYATRKPLMRRRPSGKFKMAPFQVEDLSRLIEQDNSANWSEMGCVHGSTMINVNRGGKGWSTRIDDAWQAFNGLNKHPNWNWDRNIPTYAQAYMNGRIGLHPVNDIIDSGVGETIKVTFSSGKHLICTLDHPILTEYRGWMKASQLIIGEEVLVRGVKGGYRNKPKQLAAQSLGNSRFIDKDGYVRVLRRDHHRANRSGNVYEHIIVMEDATQREITEAEHVHHKNEIRSDNRLSNLEILSMSGHHTKHAEKRFGTYDTDLVKVVAIEAYGYERVYDMVMSAPNHSFIANTVVVHNSYKTTTAEWLWQTKLKSIPNPRVLVVTTKSGKGTYFESLPEVLPEWDVFAVTSKRTMLVVGGKPIPLAVELPNPLHMSPVVVVAHYHCFTNRACVPEPKKQIIELPGGVTSKQPIVDPETGLFIMTEPKLNFLMKTHWDMIILDEAHRIKNHDAQWTHNIKKLKAQFRHVMTGTGFINNPAEVWSLLNFLYPKTYTSYWKFREKYCDEENFSGYRKVVGINAKHEQEFKELVRTVGVRRTMLECFPDIKEPITTVIPVDLNPIQAKMYKEIQQDLHTLDAAGVPLHSPNVLSMLNRLRQICVATPEIKEGYYDPVTETRMIKVKLIEPSSKLDALMELIEGLEWDQEVKDQIVVFSNFRDPLELLKARLLKKNIPHLHLRSEMGDLQRYEMWHDTWPKKEHQVFLCTLAVGSESINLTSAHRAVFLDQSWSPKDNNQAIGRLYRPGQTGVAQIIYIRAENTVDMRILASNETKTGWFKQIFGETEDDDESE